MGKAIAKSKGNRKEAEALYLEWRVELLKEEAVQEFERREAQKKAKSAGSGVNPDFEVQDWVLVMAVVFIVIAIFAMK